MELVYYFHRMTLPALRSAWPAAGRILVGCMSYAADLYGINLDQHGRPLEPLAVEMQFIAEGGYIECDGRKFGKGLYHHYRQMMDLLWPDYSWHRWRELGLKRICENDITVFCGCSDSGKTILSSSFVLCHYWVHAPACLWIVSSTELRGSELRNWGKIKELFNKARERYPWLPGKVLESKHCITSGEISEDQSRGRVLTNGIAFVPCKSGNTWLGLGAYQGVKPPDNGWLGHYGDEVSVMNRSFLDAYSNWYGKERFMGILNGNPTDIDDPLCIAAEPKGGWSEWKDEKKTQEWRSTWYNAWVVSYDGRDSPNNDYPPDQPTRFPYLIGRKKMAAVLAVERTEDSAIYRMQCVGKPLPGMEKMKVVTWQICDQGRAFEDVIWKGTPRTRLASLDAAYSGIGGDRCALGWGEFGTDTNDNEILMVYPPVNVPVKVSHLPGAKSAEDQIAEFCRDYCIGLDIPPANFFFDARATLAVAMARAWSPDVNAVEFGGSATKRPASEDEYVWTGDTEGRRLIRCDEKYSKFVTELWFCVRYLILGQQLRGLAKEVAEEGTKRLWKYTAGTPPRIEVETKKDMKKRTKESPDYFDQLATLVEGARRLGFQIKNLKESDYPDKDRNADYLEVELTKHRRFMKSRQLNYRA